MNRIAYIISAYTDAPQLARLIDALNQDADFYIHIDQKADDRPFKELLAEKATFVKSHWTSWGGWQQVMYQKELLGAVLDSRKEYSRIVCLSGQDYPLWNNGEIHRYFSQHPNTEFIMGMNLTNIANEQQRAKIIQYHFFRDVRWKNLWWKNKLIVLARNLMKVLPLRKRATVQIDEQQMDVFFGSDYWAITLPCAQFIHEKLCSQKKMLHYFRTSFIPSELCIQTIVFNSPYANRALLYEGSYAGLSALTPLHYIVYGKAIKVMTTEEDYTALKLSGKMFCRKVVSGASDTLVQKIEKDRNP